MSKNNHKIAHHKKSHGMRFLRRCMLVGLPIVATAAVLIWMFTVLDGFLAWPEKLLSNYLFGHEFIIPGLGILILLLITFLIGFLIRNYLTKWIMRETGKMFEHVPLVKMLYGSISDLFKGFVGDNKHFDKPVLVQVIPDSPIRMLGFITRDDLSTLGLTDQIAVYLPQCFNIAGTLFIVPKSAVTPLNTKSGEVMKFIVSGGLSAIQPPPDPAPHTDPKPNPVPA